MTPSTGGSWRHATAGRTGGAGARTSPIASGARSARTTRPTATRGAYLPHDHARSRAYRWGEDGLLGISDEQWPALLRARALERARPDPQGAAVRADRPGGQPRRGRQGGLRLPRRDADRPYLKALYRYPQARVPVRRPRRRERAPRPRRARIRAGRHGRPRRATASSTSSSNTPRPARRTSSSGSRPRTAGPEAATLHLLPTLWFRNTWSWGHDPEQPSIGLRPEPRGTGRPSLASHRRIGRLPAGHRPRGAVAAFTEQRDERRAALRGAERAPVRQGRLPCGDRRGTGRRRRSRRTGTKAAAHRRPASSSPAATETRPAPVGARRLGETPFAGRRRGPRRPARPRRTRSTPPLSRSGLTDDERPGPAPGVRRPDLEQAALPLRRRGVARRRSRPARRRPSARRSGRNADWRELNTTRRPVHARRLGVPVVRRLGPGLPLLPLALDRPGLRQGPAAPADARVVPASQRPAARLRVGVLGRQPAGPRMGGLARLQDRPADQRQAGPGLPRAGSSTSCCSTSPGGSTARTRDGHNVFQGGFLGLDNIGVFDRSAPLPVAGHLGQADGTAWMGFYSPRACWRSRWSSRARTRVYEDVATKFFEHFLYIAGALNGVDVEIGRPAVGSGRRVLLRRAPSRYRRVHPAQGPLAGRADPAPGGRDDRAGAASSRCPTSERRMRLVPAQPAGPGRARPVVGGARAWASGGCWRSSAATG